MDAVISLTVPEDTVRDAFAAEAANGIDLVIDYLWGRPTELLLEALAKEFSASSTRPTRLVEVGTSAGPTITLPGATLRSIDLADGKRIRIHIAGTRFRIHPRIV